MGQKIKFEDKEYDVADISEEANGFFELLQFAIIRIQELQNMHALLMRAKIGYTNILEQELLSNKSGLIFDEE
jgi:hypothetical protein